MRLGISGVGLTCLALVGLTACSDPKPEAAAEPPRDPMQVTLPKDFGASLVIREVQPEPVRHVVRVAGRIDFDEQRIARIGSTVPGRITDLQAVVGQNVAAGQSLATLTSADLGAVQLAFVKSHSQVELLTRSVERAKALLQADVIGSAELQRRQNELEVAQAEKRAATDQLRMLGLSDAAISRLQSTGTISSVKPVLATRSGTVVERNVALGQVAQPSDTLFVVADLSVVRAVADIPEQEAAGVRSGQEVVIDIPALNQSRKAHLTFMADIVNPDTRTILVRTELDNRDRALKPAMLATVRVATATAEQIALPVTAIVRDNNADHVFVETKPGDFRLVPVTLGAVSENADGHEVRPVLKGLKAGDRVVTDGAFHLNNERMRANL